MPTKKDISLGAKSPKDNVDGASAITVPDVVEERVKAAIDDWIAVHLRNSTFSANTPAWNHFMDGLPALILGITKEVKQ